MAAPRTRSSAARLRRARPLLVRRALERLDALAWFAALPAEVRAWVGVVVQGGVDAFVLWHADPGRAPAAPDSAFAAVPRSVARSVSLEQTVALVSVVVEVVEAAVPELADGDEVALRSAVERYGREVAFAVARVYARAAEQRGAWDARLQAQVIDALLAGDDERVVTARASTLGWPSGEAVRVLAAQPVGDDVEQAVDDVLRAARRLGTQVLAAAHGAAVVAVVLSTPDPLAAAAALLPGAVCVVVGPEVPGVAAGVPSARAALAGLAAAAGRPGASSPHLAADLLPERALAGDPGARAVLEACYDELQAAGGGLLETVAALLAAGGSLELTARALPVHVNTLRYRLRRVVEVLGRDPRDPRDAFVLQVALVLGRLRVAYGAP